MSKLKRKRGLVVVSIDIADKFMLDELAACTGESPQKVMHQALVSFKSKLFFEKMNRVYREMQKDSQAWAEEVSEREMFENAGGDGLS